MFFQTRLKVLVRLLLTLWIFTGLAYGQGLTTAAKMKNLKVVNYHYTTAISNKSKMKYVKNPDNARYLIIKLSAQLAEGGKIFSDDFILKYFHTDGKEDRSSADAISLALTQEIDEFDEFLFGPAAWIRLESGLVYFGLAFFLENDISSFEIFSMGKQEPLLINLGNSDRKYSVFISTNLGSARLTLTEEIIRKGGYYVNSSLVLDPEKTGTIIYYRENTENQAREISQRLIAKFGDIPTLEEMNLISEFDVVIWMGQKL